MALWPACNNGFIMYSLPLWHLWCTPTKQGTGHTGLFWDMDNWKITYLSILRLPVFLHTLICLLSPKCSLWFSMFSITSMLFLTDFQTFYHKKVCIFCCLSYPNFGNRKLCKLKADLWKSHFQRNRFRSCTQIVISQKVGGIWTWLWYQIEAESVILTTVIPKTHFTKKVTCFVFCGSASHFCDKLGA